MNYYYAEGEDQKGPINKEAFQSLVDGGVVTTSTLVWKEGLAEWVPFSEVGADFLGEGAVMASASTIQQIKEGADGHAALEIASNWRKFFSFLLDGLIVFLITYLLGLPFDINPFDPISQLNLDPTILMMKGVFDFVFGVLYYTLLLGGSGSTLAMKILGLHIVRTDGDRVSYMRALGRYFASLLSYLVLLIGYIIALFDDQKRTLHDRICDTLIVRK